MVGWSCAIMQAIPGSLTLPLCADTREQGRVGLPRRSIEEVAAVAAAAVDRANVVPEGEQHFSKQRFWPEPLSRRCNWFYTPRKFSCRHAHTRISAIASERCMHLPKCSCFRQPTALLPRLEPTYVDIHALADKPSDITTTTIRQLPPSLECATSPRHLFAPSTVSRATQAPSTALVETIPGYAATGAPSEHRARLV